MKRNEKMVPQFDEIIFENRNKEYGAFDLRKRYKSAAGFSIIGAVTLCTSLLLIISASSPDEAKARNHEEIYVVVKTQNITEPEKIVQPEPKKPAPAAEQYKYIAPEVVEDTLDLTEMMITDIATDSIADGDVSEKPDTIQYDRQIIEEDVEEEPVIFVEEPPMFPGGNEMLMKYIGEKLKYPQEALENNIQGKVFVKFAVASDGSVKRIELFKGVHPLLDQEAMRVISTLPAWKPGRQNGRAVAVWFYVPVTFQLKVN